MRKANLVRLMLFLCVVYTACKREIIQKNQIQDQFDVAAASRNPPPDSEPSCREELQPDWISDTAEVPTQLGAALLNNPYSLAVMQQAAINLYGSNRGIVANKKYIRYKPATIGQINILNDADIELFDYPLDRDVIEEGDFYPQQGIATDEIPWFYSVVEIDYPPVPGIQYEQLAILHVPDLDIWLEDEALRITGNPADDTCNNVYYRLPVPCPDPNDMICSGSGGGIGGGGNPNPNAPDTKKPAGRITVGDVTNVGSNDVPVRRTRVVARRWFKIDRFYTDDDGRFQSSKRFKNKVNMFVKFKNNQLTTRGLRGIRIWQALFPVKHGLGKYSGNLSNITQNYTSPGSGNSRSNRNWWAAQLMNAYLEFNENAIALGIGTVPTNMRILLTSWQDASGAGSTPMNHHRNVQTVSDAFTQQFVVRPLTAFWAQVYNNLYNNNEVMRGMDMTLGYRTVTARTSDQVKQLMYHELAHAAHFNKVGTSWWHSFVYSEAYTIARHGAGSNNSPYGLGDDGLISDYISLAESWAEHVGQTITDRAYGVNSTQVIRQGIGYVNDAPVVGLSSHLNYLEDFSPNRPVDPFRWIPDGLWNDLIDNRNDIFFGRVNIDDAANGYTNQQLFDALDDDITSLIQYRTRLLNENGNFQGPQVIQLFNAYNF